MKITATMTLTVEVPPEDEARVRSAFDAQRDVLITELMAEMAAGTPDDVEVVSVELQE